jgi:hypothetical protein
MLFVGEKSYFDFAYHTVHFRMPLHSFTGCRVATRFTCGTAPVYHLFSRKDVGNKVELDLEIWLSRLILKLLHMADRTRLTDKSVSFFFAFENVHFESSFK